MALGWREEVTSGLGRQGCWPEERASELGLKAFAVQSWG